MEKFIVSARKYRPQTFDTVVGQSHITTTLRNAILHRQLAHAFLFCGPRGVGKTTCARILAKTINCERPTPEGEACDTCTSCRSFNEGASMNYFELDAASNNSVDNIRDLVDQVRFVPQSGKYKVYVIDEVHMLSSAAFNAFLKTLEEPPSYAIFILATTEKHKILPTILSRCQIFDFKRITLSDTIGHLQAICQKESVAAETAALQLIAQKSEGCMRDALSILDKIVSFTGGELTYAHTLEHLNLLDADRFFKLLDAMKAQDLPALLLEYDDLNRKGFEGDSVLNGFAEFIRNLLVCRDERSATLLEAVDRFRDRYLEVARTTEPALLLSALNILAEAELNYKAARNKRLHVEMALIRLCYLQQAVRLSASDGTLEKKKWSDAPQAFRTAPSRPFVASPTPAIGDSPVQTTQTARLIVEAEPAPRTITPQPIEEPDQPATGSTGRLAALDKIRRQFRSTGSAQERASDEPLQPEQLKDAWQGYVAQLKDQKSPAVPSFERAELHIQDSNSFEVVTTSTIERQFIEQDRNRLFDWLQQHLKIRQLRFTLRVEEPEDDRIPIETSLSAREQFQRICELYPTVKELKERLKLDLDY
ncbi:MAG: hypothetical protein RJA57_1831 [Bacteroidota bacterium]